MPDGKTTEKMMREIWAAEVASRDALTRQATDADELQQRVIDLREEYGICDDPGGDYLDYVE